MSARMGLQGTRGSMRAVFSRTPNAIGPLYWGSVCPGSRSLLQLPSGPQAAHRARRALRALQSPVSVRSSPTNDKDSFPWGPGDLIVGKVVRAGHKGCVIEILDEIEGSLQPSGYQGFVPASMGPRDWGINFEIRGKHAEETMRRQAEEKASGHKRGRNFPPTEHLAVGMVREFSIVGVQDDFEPKRAFIASALSHDRSLMRQRSEQILEACQTDKEILRAVVQGHSDGGLLVRTAGHLVFIPKTLCLFPQGSTREEALPVGDVVEITIVRCDHAKGRIIGSMLDVSVFKAFRDIKVGALVEGEVVKIAQYGAYVRLDNLKCTGLLHVSNISKQFVGAAGDVFSVGERIKCIIAGYEAGFKQISLSTAELEGSPGQMVQDKAAVMSAAKDQAREFQQFLSDYVEGHEQEVIQEMDMPENSTVVADSHRTEESKGGDASGSKDGEVAAV